MVSATKLREHLWIKGGVYLAFTLIITGALLMVANVDAAFADIQKNADGSQTQTEVVKRTIIFSDGAGGQVADTVVQQATFTRTGYPKDENSSEIDWPEWEVANFAAVHVPSVSNYRANQTQVEAVNNVTPDNAGSVLRDVTVTYTKLSTTPTTSPTTTAPTVVSPTVTSPSSSSATANRPTTVTASTATPLTPTVTSSSTSTPTPTTVTTTSTAATATASTSSSALTPVTTTSTAATSPTATTGSSSSGLVQQEEQQQQPPVSDIVWPAAAAVVGAGLVGSLAYIISTRRRNQAPVNVPSGEAQSGPGPDGPSTPTPVA